MSTPARIAVAVCLSAAVFAAGWMASRSSGMPGSPGAPAASKEAARWTCPMHPEYRSDRAGDCPICGMRLVQAGAGSQSSAAHEAQAVGVVTLGPAQQQMIGLRTGIVESSPASYVLRLPGRVTPDEARLYRLVAAVDGWIRELGENSAGTFVKQNEILASYYAPSFLGAQQSFLYSLRASLPPERAEIMMSTQLPPTTLGAQTAIDSLRNLGMSDVQLDELRANKKFFSEINVYAPINGFVVSRNISPGQRFEKGSELYRIANIDRVWVMTDVFEKDREFLRPGSVATVRYQGREFQARMSDALAQLDPQSRTLRTRFELDNPGYVLRPESFVDVEVHVRMPAAVTVPADAVLDSGRRKTVFVARGDGSFEPRLVETGWRLGDRVEITKGLQAGEHVVVSGNFLIDSESRMRYPPAAAPAAAPKTGVAKDPVCGMEVDPATAGALKSEYGGKMYYFCMDDCKRKFDSNPQSYLKTSGSQPHD